MARNTDTAMGPLGHSLIARLPCCTGGLRLLVGELELVVRVCAVEVLVDIVEDIECPPAEQFPRKSKADHILSITEQVDETRRCAHH